MIGLIFLVLMTMVGLFVARSSMLQLKMSDNAGAKATSFEAAEKARITAEKALITVANGVSQSGVYDCAKLGAGYFARAGSGGQNCQTFDLAAMNWDNNDSVAVNGNLERYAIEYLGEDEVNQVADEVETGSTAQGKVKVLVFRIVARGRDAAGAETIVKTVFLVRKS